MTGRNLLANILWRSAAVLAIITASISGSVLIEQQIVVRNRHAQDFQVQINKLNQEVQALQHPKTSSSQQKLTTQFIGEVNYICAIEADVAKANGFPPPSTGLCSLVVPKP